MRKKQKRYKLITARAPEEAPLPARVVAIVAVVQWASWFALMGVLVSFLLIASLYTHWRIPASVWLGLWPASIRLMTATGLSPHQMTHLAFWMAGENGLIYGLIGILLGGLYATYRLLRRRLRYNRSLRARTRT